MWTRFAMRIGSAIGREILSLKERPCSPARYTDARLSERDRFLMAYSYRASAAAGLVLLLQLVGSVPAHAETTLDSGESVYRAACAACHGPDGRGAPQLTVGFDVPLPDFTDCSFNSREPAARLVCYQP